ncbi:MAG: hypothetical protein JW902_00160 [Syntrophaceae bacterium]|nr:hypothetical protein [Syntrophaceae bacterium]
MVRVTLFNTISILSVTAAMRISYALVMLFVLLCIGTKDLCLFAQTAEIEPDRFYNEISDLSQAKPGEELPSVETPDQREPRVIRETVEPVAESWGSTEGFGKKIDWIHGSLFKIAQAQVEMVDNWFKPPQGEQPVVELSRFRVGLFAEGKIQEYKETDVKPVVDFDTEIELPNLKRQIKLIITTSDHTMLPGKSFIEQRDNSLRTAVVGQLRSDISTAIGVRARWKPELFAYAVWAHKSEARNWRLYPQQKFYWESKDGFGEISTLVLDHWINRWNTRFSTSVKWSKQDRDDDQKAEREDNGFRWSEVFLLEYAKELLDESQLGRVVSGHDIARGWGIRLSAFGGFHFADEYRAGIFYRWPLRKKWMYLYAGPEIKWKNVNKWDREWNLRCGIEMLFWGGKER